MFTHSWRIYCTCEEFNNTRLVFFFNFVWLPVGDVFNRILFLLQIILIVSIEMSMFITIKYRYWNNKYKRPEMFGRNYFLTIYERSGAISNSYDNFFINYPILVVGSLWFCKHHFIRTSNFLSDETFLLPRACDNVIFRIRTWLKTWICRYWMWGLFFSLVRLRITMKLEYFCDLFVFDIRKSDYFHLYEVKIKIEMEIKLYSDTLWTVKYELH